MDVYIHVGMFCVTYCRHIRVCVLFMHAYVCAHVCDHQSVCEFALLCFRMRTSIGNAWVYVLL